MIVPCIRLNTEWQAKNSLLELGDFGNFFAIELDACQSKFTTGEIDPPRAGTKEHHATQPPLFHVYYCIPCGYIMFAVLFFFLLSLS